MKTSVSCLTVALLFTPLLAVTQDTAPNTSAAGASLQAVSSSAPVPRLIRFAGVAKDENGQPLNGTVGITFSLYKDQESGAPLWLETQNVTPGSTGNYTVQLGATLPEGLPADIFASAEARWLGIQISGQAEQPRVLLLAVPYALKAVDAETIGGLPPSAFVRASSEGSSATDNSAALGGTSVVNNSGTAVVSGGVQGVGRNVHPPALFVETNGGTPNYLPMFTASNIIGNSNVFQSGGNVGIGTTNPGRMLEVAAADSNDGIKITGKTSNRSWLMAVGVAAGDGKLAFYDFGAAQHRLTIDTAGNVGIGTTNPTQNLQVSGLNPVISLEGSNIPSFQVLSNASTAREDYRLEANRGGNGELSVSDCSANCAERLTVTKAGNVGIGTTNPGRMLELAAADSNDGIKITGNTSNRSWLMAVGVAAGDGKLTFYDYGAGLHRLTIDELGNVGIGTTTPMHPLQMGDGAYEDGKIWTNGSDRNLKENFRTVNGRLLLVHLDKIPMMTWNFKDDDRSVRHLGPMAQDFYTAFGLDGKDDKHISTLDEGGVALAAVQELYRMVLRRDREVRNLEELARNKDEQIARLTTEVERLERLEQVVRVLSTKMMTIETGKQTEPELLRASK